METTPTHEPIEDEAPELDTPAQADDIEDVTSTTDDEPTDDDTDGEEPQDDSEDGESEPEQLTPPPTIELPDEDDDEEMDFSRPEPLEFDLPPLAQQLAELPVDEDGNANAQDVLAVIAQREEAMQSNMQKVVEAAVSEVERRNAEANHERKLWTRAETVLPEMKENKELRDMVQDIRAAAIIRGGNLSPAKAAERVQKMLGGAKERGARAMTETVKVQKSARLESSSTYAEPGDSRQSDLVARSRSTNRADADAARRELLKSMVFGS